MTIAKCIFWASGLLIFYSYAGYPLLLRVLSILMSPLRKSRPGEADVKVTLIVSAYNEAGVIEEKIKNALASDYPGDLLEVVVVSDGSTDGTDEIVERYSKEGVVLRRYEGRTGKTACLNRAVPLSKGDVIVFSDANSKYDRAAISNIVSSFTEEVGFVTGITRYGSRDGAGVDDSVGIYSRLETYTKDLESKVSSCIGADGAIFAIRKSLFRELKAYDINDFVIPLSVIKQGYRGVQCKEAYCVEETAGSTKGEFNRQVRITARTIRAIFNNAALLNPLRYGFFSLELFSHKLLKLSVPFFMVLFFASDLVLLGSGWLYKAAFTLQGVFYLAAFARYMAAGLERTSRFFSIPYTFTAVNIAMLMGWIKYLKGETFVTWSPTQR